MCVHMRACVYKLDVALVDMHGLRMRCCVCVCMRACVQRAHAHRNLLGRAGLSLPLDLCANRAQPREPLHRTCHARAQRAAHTRTHAPTHTRLCTHTYAHAHVHRRTHTRTQARAHARTRPRTQGYAQTHTHTHRYTVMHTHAHTRTQARAHTRARGHTRTFPHAERGVPELRVVRHQILELAPQLRVRGYSHDRNRCYGR
jgi:hypothetical protein